MKELLIIGASGHGKVVADIARLNGYGHIAFLDDNADLKECGAYPVIGKSCDFDKKPGDLFVAIGNAVVRQKLLEAAENANRHIPILVHPNATVAQNATFGKGTVVMAGAVINSDTQIGKGCIINTSASVDHDCVLGDYVHVSVDAHLAGTVMVGVRTWIGIGAVVSNNLVITSDCMIGAGAAVIDDLTECGTYVGVPARRIK